MSAQNSSSYRTPGSMPPAVFFMALLQWFKRTTRFGGLSALGLLLLPALLEASQRFPLYASIRPNVAFWEDIYGRYTTRQAVLHDSVDLSRVYMVVELVDRDLPLASRINELRTTQAKNRLSALFDGLSAGVAPRTAEERRIAAMFAGQPRSAYRKAKENLRFQLGQKDRFHEGVIRSGKYMAYIRQVLAEENLPLELAYLPHVESSFHPGAGSKAGAYGLWQFTRSTGKEYMTVNSLVDERFDPYISTRAAARLLKENYETLGNWPLAMTAYNYGRAGMVRALRAHGSYEAIFQDYAQGYFKFASRNFYSEFLAAMRVAKRLEQSGLALDQPEPVRTYRLKEEVAVSKLQAKHQLDKAQFIRYNPALLTPVLSGRRKVPVNYLVRVPAVNTLQQQAKKASPARKTTPTAAAVPQPRQNMSAPVSGKKDVSRSYYHYTVAKGDTLSAIARRFDISQETILVANNKGPHNPVRVGDRLVVPVKRQQ